MSIYSGNSFASKASRMFCIPDLPRIASLSAPDLGFSEAFHSCVLISAVTLPLIPLLKAKLNPKQSWRSLLDLGLLSENADTV